jgi:hypothetical protein
MAPTGEMPEGVKRVAEDLSRARPMRRGSLSERWMKCGHGTCACHRDPSARHGPYLSLSRVVEGRTRSRYVGSEQGNLVREQLAAGQAFRARVEGYWQACEAWADATLEAAQAEASDAEAERGGSRRTSRTRSRRKSER